MDINVIVTKRDRDKQYDVFLHYLNKISEGHDVKVYVTSDSDVKVYSDYYFKDLDNIWVDHEHAEVTPPEFNKSSLLNMGLARMRSHADVVCIMGTDYIYNLSFFKQLEYMLHSGHNCIVSHGKNLDEEPTADIIERMPSIEEVRIAHGIPFSGCSQISMTEDFIDLLEDIFGTVYDASLVLWDSADLFNKSQILHERGLICKGRMENAWNHLYHPSRKDDTTVLTDEEIINGVVDQAAIENKIEDYITKHKGGE